MLPQSGHMGLRHLRRDRDRRGRLAGGLDARGTRLALFSAGRAAVKGMIGSVGNAYQVIGAEGVAATVAMELRATRTEHFAAFGAWLGFEVDVSAVFVVFNGEAVKTRLAVGAGGGGEFRFHA